MGTLVFIDLRDRTGIVQLAFDDKSDPALLAKAQKVRAEYVLMARGILRQRESINHEIPTGEVEVYVTELRVLAESNTPPFAISDDSLFACAHDAFSKHLLSFGAIAAHPLHRSAAMS